MQLLKSYCSEPCQEKGKQATYVIAVFITKINNRSVQLMVTTLTSETQNEEVLKCSCREQLKNIFSLSE